ncbi:ergosterol biosynthesis protein-like protein [Periconia macrospinosa]|uniref:Ergosterol biosynthesis protein-like protein n=1 Tax=Periconia macrospinosa TaxID=97972 RepID=A0A2V1DM86_9PLEO|nr:ergosterol biosynthesis protein-like protein [Periconia macrospinosa]
MASTLTSLLPQSEGWLPSWLLFTSLISIFNTIQSYTSTTLTARVYNPNPPPSSSTTAAALQPTQVTPLTGRLFGTWTLLAAVIRLYGAYYISEKPVYELAMAAYAVAWAHFMSEWWVFGTTRWGMPIAGPAFISTGTLAWMVLQREFYLGL